MDDRALGASARRDGLAARPPLRGIHRPGVGPSPRARERSGATDQTPRAGTSTGRPLIGQALVEPSSDRLEQRADVRTGRGRLLSLVPEARPFDPVRARGRLCCVSTRDPATVWLPDATRSKERMRRGGGRDARGSGSLGGDLVGGSRPRRQEDPAHEHPA